MFTRAQHWESAILASGFHTEQKITNLDISLKTCDVQMRDASRQTSHAAMSAFTQGSCKELCETKIQVKQVALLPCKQDPQADMSAGGFCDQHLYLCTKVK